jgi:predicted DNA repair protein MutK
VALVVRMDDLGFMLIVKSNSQGFFNTIGQLLVKTLPVVIKIFSVVGTLALLLVAGGIFSHNIEYLHHILPEWPSIIKEFVFGVVAGIIVFVLIGGIKNMIKLVKTKN